MPRALSRAARQSWARHPGGVAVESRRAEVIFGSRIAPWQAPEAGRAIIGLRRDRAANGGLARPFSPYDKIGGAER